MYKIRSCKTCGQKLHVRQKNKQVQIKNRCIHIPEAMTTNEVLDGKTVSVREFRESVGGVRTIPHMCIIHNSKLSFVQQLGRSVELYQCKRCKIVHLLMQKGFIASWKKQQWSKNWHPGDVKLIIKGD